MGAALRLRLLEARRRGGLVLVAVAFLAVAGTALWGGATPDGRYGLASDLASTLAYTLAILFGTVPVAVDRERRRSYLPSASPVTPWGWAIGNALGAAVIAAGTCLVLHVAAGVGTAASGGIDTYEVTGEVRVKQRVVWDPFPAKGIRLEPGSTRLRLVTISRFREDNPVGASFAARIDVDGTAYTVHPNRPLIVPVTGERTIIRNVSPDFRVGLVTREIRSYGAERSFVGNAAVAGAGPALGAAAIAALATAAGANLSAGVAALAMTLLLLLAAMKGFLGEMLEFEGSLRAEHSHSHDEAPAEAGVARAAAKVVLRGTLAVLPDLDELDHTDRVATGEWTGLRGPIRMHVLWDEEDIPVRELELAAAVFVLSLVVAGAFGALGVHVRRTP